MIGSMRIDCISIGLQDHPSSISIAIIQGRLMIMCSNFTRGGNHNYKYTGYIMFCIHIFIHIGCSDVYRITSSTHTQTTMQDLKVSTKNITDPADRYDHTAYNNSVSLSSSSNRSNRIGDVYNARVKNK